MPEQPSPKTRVHPWVKHGADPSPSSRLSNRGRSGVSYAELHTTTNFTFLTGASHPEELVERAAALGHAAVAVTDRNSLAGIVRAHVAAKDAGIPLVIGTRLHLEHSARPPGRLLAPSALAEFIRPGGVAREGSRDAEGLSILVYVTDRAAYARLCRLLTCGKRRAPKGECRLTVHDVVEHQEGMLAVVVPPRVLDQSFLETLEGLHQTFDDDRLSLAASCAYGSDDRSRLAQLAALAEHTRVPLVATNNVHYHVPERRPLQDVVTCIRHGCTLYDAGLRLLPNAERFLKTPTQMMDLFAEYPDAIARTTRIAERASGFNLDELRYEYPHEVCPPGRTPIGYLRDLVIEGARERYPTGIPEKVRDALAHELTLIEELDYASYFLTVHDLVRFARSREILCQGRGAAANSAVCYCLGVTAVDPKRHDLLFERFISRERDEPPDIDIDFEHERREEVIQYIYGKYGRERAALTAEVITYRGRSAVRDVGKVLGLSLDCVDRLARNIDWWHGGLGDADAVRDAGVNPDDPMIKRLALLGNEILGFPRHLSQHVGGFVITQNPLSELVPIENAAMPDRTVIEWDKDDIDAMGMLKVDVLGLGMLTCIRKALDLVNEITRCWGGREEGHGEDTREDLSLHTVPAEDPVVYDMICKADTVGVFQIESRAQMSMLPRLRPRCFYDLVIEVAIVRPGPIQGDMVHPYLRRRNGEEPVTYPNEAVRDVLGKTLGVPLFQEQAMSLAIVAAGFTPGEADELRRAMAAWKRKGNAIEQFGQRLVRGMVERGYEREFAERCYRQIQGFSDYGFPESHAASFAHLVYVSAWLKRHHPEAFAAALINSQPMGFYAPAQIIRDAIEHDVTVQPADVNRSQWDCTLETGDDAEPRLDVPFDLRLGLRLVKGLREDDGQAIATAVERDGPFASIDRLRRVSGVRVAALRRLAAADAFGSMGLDRQRALWEVRALRDETLPLFDAVEPPPAPEEVVLPEVPLPEVSLPEQVARDYETTQLSLRAHPVSFLRKELTRLHAVEAAELKDEKTWGTGRRVAVAGLVLVRQRPSTANGIVFMTLEDETGIANLIVSPEIYKRDRRVARHGVAILARGTVERQGEVVHVKVARLEGLDERFTSLAAARSRDFH